MLCKKRITQSDVARWCGVSQPYICKLELGLVFPTAAMLPGILNGYAVRTEAEFRRMWEYPLDWNALPLWNFTRRLKPVDGIVLADLPAIPEKAVSA